MRMEIAANEGARHSLEEKMENLLQGDKHHGLVRLLKHYRQQALTNMELHFQASSGTVEL